MPCGQGGFVLDRFDDRHAAPMLFDPNTHLGCGGHATTWLFLGAVLPKQPSWKPGPSAIENTRPRGPWACEGMGGVDPAMGSALWPCTAVLALTVAVLVAVGTLAADKTAAATASAGAMVQPAHCANLRGLCKQAVRWNRGGPGPFAAAASPLRSQWAIARIARFKRQVDYFPDQ